MKITIDASQIVYGTGVSVYTKNLIRSLAKVDRSNTYQIIGGSLRKYYELKKEVDLLYKDKKNYSSLLFPIPPTFFEFIFNRIGVVKIDTLIGKPDVFHSSDWTQPYTDAYKVTTIHDLIPIKYPKLIDPKITAVHKRRLERVRKYVDKIIVPSSSTREDMINVGFKEEKIVIIPEAPDPELKRPLRDDILKTMKRYRINGNYLLAIGTNPRKNVDRIISAFEKLRADSSIKLVFIGEIKKAVLVRNVIFLGHIPREDMSKIYCGCEALIYPSLYEGFGLPVLEAFSLGVPVLTSNIGSLKEVGNNAAVLVDPYNVDAIVDGMTKLLSKKEEYIKKGREVVKKYTWEESARKTLQIYEKSGG